MISWRIHQQQQSLQTDLYSFAMTTAQLSFSSHYGEEYTITLEFELQREKEKNKILEERLRNKEIFIVEMKKMQGELEYIGERSRAELLEERQKRQQLETLVREQAEKMAEMSHRIRLLERGDFSRQQKCTQNAFYSSKSVSKLHEKRQPRLAQLSPDRTRVPACPPGANQDDKQSQLHEVYRNFSTRFLQMFALYSPQDVQDIPKKRLKSAWKWIKAVVKEWQYGKATTAQILRYIDRCRSERRHCEPDQILQIQSRLQDSEVPRQD